MKSDDGKMVVEFAKASDAVEIGNLSQHYVEHGLGWRYTPSRIKKLISNKSKNVVVARNDDELVGFGIMTYERDQANLDLLGVKVSYRRQGIGTLVVNWLEEVADLAGVYNVYVQARKTNQSAIKFYQKLNYLVIDEKKGLLPRQRNRCDNVQKYKANDNKYMIALDPIRQKQRKSKFFLVTLICFIGFVLVAWWDMS